jgi:hypothetical protein
VRGLVCEERKGRRKRDGRFLLRRWKRDGLCMLGMILRIGKERRVGTCGIDSFLDALF